MAAVAVYLWTCISAPRLVTRVGLLLHVFVGEASAVESGMEIPGV